MISIDALELEHAEARARAIALRSWRVEAERLRRNAPSGRLAGFASRTVEATDELLDEAQAHEAAVERQLAAALGLVSDAARTIAAQARAGRPCDDLEIELLDWLGTYELPPDGLTPVDHAYVVAALRAREPSREQDHAFAAFVTARAALAEGTKAA
jgi:hypothetical protein